MLRKWRSLVVTGVMLSALVLGSTAAHAQTPPTNPTSLTVVPEGYTSLRVTWPASANLATEYTGGGYELRHQQVADAATAIDLTNAFTIVNVNNVQTYLIGGLTAGKNHVVEIRTYGNDADDDPDGGVLRAAWAGATAAVTAAYPVPGNVMDLELEAGDGHIVATWDPADGKGIDITGYEVRVTPKGGQQSIYQQGTMTTRTIGGLTNDVEHTIEVLARSLGGASATPTSAKATPTAPAITPPMNVMAMAGDAMISVSWDAVDKADSYEVSWWPTGGGVTSNAKVTEMSYDIMNLMNGTEYEVTVASMMGDEKSEASEIVRATPMAMDPVPALPLFGMLALGAGLVAAGRRRLHAQRLLKN